MVLGTALPIGSVGRGLSCGRSSLPDLSRFLAAKEEEKGVVRGEPGSIVTAMCYGEYSPNPGSIASMAGQFDAAAYEKLKGRFSPTAAWFTEFWER